QLDSEYSTSLHRYERALKQRNNLLKQSSYQNDSIFAWSVALSQYGAYIVERRQWLVQRISELINQTYLSIAQIDDRIEILYSFEHTKNIQQKLMNDLEKNLEKDKLLGTTTSGIHRHDLLINFNSKPITAIASRGEVRTVVLSLKFIEVTLVEQNLGHQPIILLDDVFGELDTSRQKELIHSFKDYQIIITATSLPKSKLDALIVKL
ncbi:MAG: DNA replication/repair protein RecF, partial [Candidatus Saccharimonas sp.]